ncbi:MAG TPA: hypothetical protein PKD70_01795 [Saprospiraceae bacterium]|nr:hypothetical protein [Saprospiraceae bacterium]HMP12582.1 hypothetical protein [Saprospiraceae bacterium]
MKILSFITSLVFAVAVSFTPVQADDNLHYNLNLPEGIETTVIQCGNDPDGNWRCVHTIYNDGSDCIVVDNEGADNGIAFFRCDN